MEIDEGMMLLGLRAASWGIPFIPTEVGLGTDVINRNPDIKVIDSPYDDKEWVAMPALKLDVSLIHADRADVRGVCQIAGPDIYMDDWLLARPAKRLCPAMNWSTPSTFTISPRLDWFTGSVLQQLALYPFPEALTPLRAPRSTVSTYRTSRLMPPREGGDRVSGIL